MTGALEGFTVALTAERRADEFATLLERRGARVLHARAIHVLPLTDDSELREQTARIISNPAEIVIISTGIGFRGWLQAAAEWGIESELTAALGSTRLIARGPKAKGAIRGVGLREQWSPDSEASQEVAAHLASEGVEGVDIAVQLHGVVTEWEPTADLSQTLRSLGAHVRPISVYRWIRPPDQTQINDLIAKIIGGEVDAVAFTSAPAVASILSSAKDTERLEPLLTAFREKVAAMCVGPVTAAPLNALGVPTSMPARARLGSLAKFIIDELPARG